jgi:uncharacterized protein YbjT (DUF2867 family)
MKFLITGATGNIGSRVVDRLLEYGERPRAFVRDAGKARARFGDRVDILVGDLSQPESLQPALSGVDSLLLINSGAEIPQRDEAVAYLAKLAGVKHLVKLSALSAAKQIAIGAWHAKGEAAILGIGVPFTFLRPAGFMSNVLEWAQSIKSEGVVRACTGQGRVAYIHPDDVADVAVHVLITGAPSGASLEITGGEALSYGEMTAIVSSAIGKPLRFETVCDDMAREHLIAIGVPRLEAEGIVGLWCAIREGRLSTVNDGVKLVLGRVPITFAQWATENKNGFS